MTTHPIGGVGLARDVLDVALLHQAVEVRAERHPLRVAIDDGGRTITYGELGERMRRLASVLLAAGVRRGDRVALLASNGIDACAAILGILRAGACYVPLDPMDPPLRLAAIMSDAQPAAVVAVTATLARLGQAMDAAPEYVDLPLVVLDATTPDDVPGGHAGPLWTQPDLAVASAEPPPAQGIEGDLAVIPFTSGPTGKPKGIMLSHRAVKSAVRWAVDYFAMVANDRLSNYARLSVDGSILDIFCAAFAGATLCPIASGDDPGAFIRRRRITVWLSAPGAVGAMKPELTARPFGTLRVALFTGEGPTPDWAAAWRLHQPAVPIYTLYGQTEAMIACTVHDAAWERSIGRATRDTELVVLAMDADRSAEPNEPGRLFVLGSQLAEGYWRRPDLTEKVFRTVPLQSHRPVRLYDTGDLAARSADGTVTVLGRRDARIGIGGQRVELGEVEAALAAHPEIHEAAAVLLPGDDPAIVGIVAPVDDCRAGDEAAILAHLSIRLPAYMVPRRVVFVSELPRKPGGKIDRGRLAADVAVNRPR